MTFSIPRSNFTSPFSLFHNHHIDNSGSFHYLNGYYYLTFHPVSGTSCSCQDCSMSSKCMSSGSDTRVFVPSPLWWQPCTRWVAITHLPTRLHTHSTLAPLIAHFGSLVSFSYPANREDKKVLLALVANSFITKIPHISPVKDGDKIFPVKIQVIYQTRISEKGIIFDPLDSGDAFCDFYSQGQCPSDSQLGATFSFVPTTLSHARIRDKRNLALATPTTTMPPPPPPQAHSAHATSSSGHDMRDEMLVSTLRNTRTRDLAFMEQALCSAIHKFKQEAVGPTSDCDKSGHDKSHQSLQTMLTAEKGMQNEGLSSMGIVEGKGKTKGNLLLANNISVNQSVRVDSALDKLFVAKTALSNKTVQLGSPGKGLSSSYDHGNQLESNPKAGTLRISAEHSEAAVAVDKKHSAWDKDTGPGWANPPVVFKRRKTTKLFDQKDDDWLYKPIHASGNQKDKDSPGRQDDDGTTEGKVMRDLGPSDLLK